MAAKKATRRKKASELPGKSTRASKPRKKTTTRTAGRKIQAEEALEKMREVASREITKKSAKIIRKLAEKAEDGNATCVKMLVDFVRWNKQPQSKPGKSGSNPNLIPFRDWVTDSEWKQPDKPAPEMSPNNN